MVALINMMLGEVIFGGVGAGFYGIAIIATVVSIATLTIFSLVEEKLQNRRTYSYSIGVNNLANALASLNTIFQALSIAMPAVNFTRDGETYTVWFNLFVSPDNNLRVIEKLSTVQSVVRVETGTIQRNFQQPPAHGGHGGG